MRLTCLALFVVPISGLNAADKPINQPAITATSYEAEVPDTLDLVQKRIFCTPPPQ